MTEKQNNNLDLIVYQIYPRSFMDGNGDGIGDIKGITAKLDHLVELGINAVWLSPCYKSPNCDNGYDISDYRDIMDEFGTLGDWKEMISQMHKRGIKLIMDFVANHTSSEHEWFKQARSSRTNKYHDYYIWRDSIPNDWQSVFGGCAWEYNEPTNEYYLHSFAIGQPDLNWENEKVRKEMADVIDYWVELGVDGFRCDVLNYIAKDFEKGLMNNGPHMHEYIKELFGREKVKHIFTVGECSMGEDSISDICGEGRDELTCIFQFDHFDHGRTGKFDRAPYKIDEIRNDLVKWQYFTEKQGLLYTLFTDNHDQPHYISRLGNDKEYRYECATMYAAMFYLLKGIPFVYQGQEYGAPDPHYSEIDDFDDVETFNYFNACKEDIPYAELLEKVNFGSRDNVRRPVCWDNSKNYGFSSADKTWIKLHSRGGEVNLENDKKSDKSVFEFYKRVLALRKNSEVVRYGRFDDLTEGDGYFAYTRTQGDEQILVVCNFDKPTEISGLPEYKYLFGNYGKKRKANGKYAPFEVAVFCDQGNKMKTFEIFDMLKTFGTGVQFFVPEYPQVYFDRQPCKGFGSVRYYEGSVYVGELYFDGKNYNKLGFGRQEFLLSLFGNLNTRNIRRAFYIGSFDYRETGWIYGNGVMYYVDNDNKPACFVKGFFSELHKIAEYDGVFSYDNLAEGFTPDMEVDFDEWDDTLYKMLSKSENLTELENLFIGDSYFELWCNKEYCGKDFYEIFDNAKNLNMGVGGTRFSEWKRFIYKLNKLSIPKRIFVNLGFNDIHCGRSADIVFNDCIEFINLLNKRFPQARIYLLNIVKAPSMTEYYLEEEKFNALTKAAADNHGIRIVDMRSQIAPTSNVFHSDRLHLNARGYEYLINEIERILKA